MAKPIEELNALSADGMRGSVWLSLQLPAAACVNRASGYQGDFFGPNHHTTPNVAVFCSRFNAPS